MGSGLSEAAVPSGEVEEVRWEDIPKFPTPSVKSHKGVFLSGELGGKSVLIQQGRVHWYEVKEVDEILFPVRVMKLLGIDTILMTNAAGGINSNYQPGDLVLLKDHINGCGQNPLRGPNIEELGPRFPDLSNAYDPRLRDKCKKVADSMGNSLAEGVYIMTSGPSYETPAEIEAFRRIGADLVGMSTVPEAIAANHCGMDVVGISCVTNMAAGLQEELSHEEVLETTQKANEKFARLITEFIKNI